MMNMKEITVKNLTKYSLFLFIFLLPFIAFSQTESQIPGGTDNYLQISNSNTAGVLDAYCVVFYEIPETIVSRLYFGIYDPDMYYINPMPTPPPYNPTSSLAEIVLSNF